MMKSKLMKVVMATTLMVTSLIGIGTALAAEAPLPTNAEITVHKHVWPTGQMPDQIQNTGEVMNFGGTALNGAGFSVYDVTTEYYQKLGSQQGEEAVNAVVAEIQSESTAGAPAYATQVGTEKITAGEGIATFSALPVHQSGQYAAYLILETTTPVTTPGIMESAAPMVVVMPVYKPGTTTVNSQIHLYPKNETGEDQKVLTNRAVFDEVSFNGQKYPNISTGDVLDYTLTVNIPVNIADGDVQSFVIRDTPSNGLALADLAAVKVGDLAVGTDYTITALNDGFEIKLKMASEQVKKLAGKKLLITYGMKVTAALDPDQLIENKANIIVNNQPGTELVVASVTGGKQFKKIDSQTDKGLVGAQFIVKKDAQFATFKTDANNQYRFEKWVSDETQATKITSGTDGQFAVVGLVNGDYTLIEVTAPDGYLLNDSNRPTKDFTVVAGEYQTETIKFENIRKGGFLPQTGSIGIYAFIAVGLALMGGAYFWHRKVKRT